MWSDSKRKSSTSAVPKKFNLRFVPKTRWELPRQKQKSYWQDVLENMDKGSMKVNPPLFSLFPTPSPIPLECSVSIRDKPLTDPATPDAKTIIIKNEPIVKISPPSPSHDGLAERSSLTDSLEYLKSHDVSNFDLDLLPQKMDSDEKKLKEENAVDAQNEKDLPQLVKTPLILPGIGQISQLTKISRYVNDFLASTRVKVGGSISPKNHVHPQCQLSLETPRRNDRLPPEESPAVAEAEQTPVDEPESIEIQEKHVMFQNTGEDDVETIDNSYGRVSRPRAPSLGVASLVPSFGRMISSLEYSDSIGSRSSIESPPDDANITEGTNPSQSSALGQSQRTPDMRTKCFLEAPAVHYPSKSIYPDVRRFKDSESKFSGSSHPKGYQHWPRKMIVHTIRALKNMKSGTEASERFHHKRMTFGSSPSSVQGHSIVRKSSSSSTDLVSPTGASGSTTSSDDNTNQTVLRTISGKVRVGERLRQVPLMKKPSFRLEDLPPMGGMYQRKKRNKCLACMCRSEIKLESVFRLPDQIDATPYESVIAEFDNLLAMKFTERITKSREKSELSDDEVSPLSEDSKPSAKANEFDDLISFEIRPMRASYSERKFTQSSVREDLTSAKSFVSTLSLTSDQSRTVSEHEDSDHGLETVAEAGEDLPGTGSKFRAPCHAPLNLKPSLEPLMALRGKKSKSIQSRSASLEKSLEEGSEEASDDDDDEVEETAIKLRGEKIKELSPLKPPGDGQISDAVENQKKEYPASPEETESDKPPPEPELEPQKSPDEDHVFIPTVSTQSGKLSLSEMIYHQLNVKISSTDHNPSRSFDPLTPVMSDSEIMEIVKRSLAADKPIKDILFSLLEEYCHRLSMNTSNKNQRIAKITNRLLALLVDSKLYLNPEFTSSNLQFSSKQKPFCNSQQLRRFLPFKSYNLVAPILGMPEWHPKRWSALKSVRSLKAGFKSKIVTTMVDNPSSVSVVSTKTESEDDFDLIVHPPSPRESLDEGAKSQKQKKMNPYASFMSKPRRKVVIWRALTERDLEGYDPDSTLKNRAAKVTDKICKDFCDWLRSLGGSHDTIDEQVLKDMFETDFTAEACRTMRVCVKEMPMVPTAVAAMRHCHESGEPEVTRRQLIRDVGAERKPPKIVGFGSTVPNHVRYEPPRNNVYDKWIHCSSVPQDLESMSFVWKDITHLDSVRGFSRWLKRHSRVKLPKELQKLKKKMHQ